YGGEQYNPPRPFVSFSSSTSRPRQGDRSKRNQIDLGIDGSCIWAAMPQQITNLMQRRPVFEHRSGQTVPEQVRSSIGGLDSSFRQRSVHQRANRHGVGETHQRRLLPNKDTPTRTSRPNSAEIDCYRRAHFGRQGHLCHSLALAPNRDHALFPVDVVQRQRHYFTSTKTEPCQQKQNAVVAFSAGGVSVAGVQDTLDLLGGKKLRHIR